MIAKKLLTTIAFAFVLLFSGCATDDFIEIDGVCPLVVSTVPENNATGVPLNQVITATFNEIMNASTISKTSFTISDNGALIDGTVTYSGLTATFTPTSPLDENTKYTGTIKTSAKDLKGNALQEDYVWTFTTLETFSVVVSSSPVLGGVTTGAGRFNQGAPVTVKAVPNTNYSFVNWTENGIVVSPLANYTFVIVGNRTLVANYIPNLFAINLSSNPAIGGSTSGAGSFDFGSSRTVTATPNANYTFTNWTENGTVVSTNASYTFVLNANKTLVANFTIIPQFAIILSANPAIGGSTSGAGSFNVGTSRTVTATPTIPGYTFVNWTEAGVEVSTTPSYTFILNANKTLVANFIANLYTITLSSNPTIGGSTSGAGSFSFGSSKTVTATPNAGYTFKNWTLAGVEVSTTPSYTFVLNANTALVANFVAITYTLNVTAVNGTVVKNPNTATYSPGASVILTPSPNPGYVFTSWSGDATGTNNPLTVTMNSNKNITANFSLIGATYTLNVTAVNGNVVKNPNTPTYNPGVSVILTPTPNSGYEFLSWGGDATGTDDPLTVVMNSNKNITANFVLLTSGGACPSPAVDLGLAKNYAILAESGISTTGTTSVTGNMGISPAAATFITGFGLSLTAGAAYSTSSIVTGKIYAPGYANPTPANLTTAVGDMHTAFTTANGLAPTQAVNFLSGNLNGQTLVSGVYKWTSGVSVTNSITLDGGGQDCAKFVFQIAGDLTVANGTKIILINGAKADNIFWVVAGSGAMLGTTVNFNGNILSKTLISVNTGSIVNGRLLAQTAVTLNASSIVKP